jgi:hypothetical protein
VETASSNLFPHDATTMNPVKPMHPVLQGMSIALICVVCACVLIRFSGDE